MKMKKIYLLSIILLFFIAIFQKSFAENLKSKQPNIVVIWGDDIGQFNISFWNRGQMGYETPNIDRIAKEGVAFTDYYGEQSCTAARASFITGQTGLRTGLTKVGLPGSPQGMKEDIPTLAAMLKREGYATVQFGKNHLGDKDNMLPTNNGFDEFYGNLYHSNAEEEPEHRDYPKVEGFKEKYGPRGVIHSYADGRISDTGPMTAKRMETMDLEIVERAEEYIHQQSENNKPFFMWYNTLGMHWKTHARPEIKNLAGPNSNDYMDAMVDHDRYVGRILTAIEEAGLEENTIVIYSTDNGPQFNTWPDAAVTPYRGEKNTNWEGAYRVPCFVKWAGVIPEGQISNDIVSHLDWFPTLLAAAGNDSVKQELLEGIHHNALNREYKAHLDGFNLLPHLKDVKNVPSPRKEFFYFSDDGQFVGVRYEDWKIVFMEQRASKMEVWTEPLVELRCPKLFNLRRDPYERADTESNNYWEWFFERAPYCVLAQDRVAAFLQTFQEFPQRQRPASFSVDQIVEMFMRQGENIENIKN